MNHGAWIIYYISTFIRTLLSRRKRKPYPTWKQKHGSLARKGPLQRGGHRRISCGSHTYGLDSGHGLPISRIHVPTSVPHFCLPQNLRVKSIPLISHTVQPSHIIFAPISHTRTQISLLPGMKARCEYLNSLNSTPPTTHTHAYSCTCVCTCAYTYVEEDLISVILPCTLMLTKGLPESLPWHQVPGSGGQKAITGILRATTWDISALRNRLPLGSPLPLLLFLVPRLGGTNTLPLSLIKGPKPCSTKTPLVSHTFCSLTINPTNQILS